MTQEQVGFPGHGAPDGECDNMCALRLIARLMTGTKLGVVVQSSADNNNIISEALKRDTAVDNARALVTMGELAQFRMARQILPPMFNRDTCEHACAMEGEEVLTVRMEEQGTQNRVSGIRRKSQMKMCDRD